MEATDNNALQRSQTDASLDAERSTADAKNDPGAIIRGRRSLDRLMERDRMLADAQLLRFRDKVDGKLALKRYESPSQFNCVANERSAADRDKQVERDGTDALLERERHETDATIQRQRSEYDGLHTGLQNSRKDTDVHLLAERNEADATADALGVSKSALTVANGEREHRDDILGMVAHDLRSPLSAILLGAEHIGEVTQDVAIRESAETMVLAAVRMERLLMDLLDVARIESGTLSIGKKQHDLARLLREVLKSYEGLFADRQMSLAVDAPLIPAHVSFDHDRIVQVLSNLLTNAMKFTPAGGEVRLNADFQENQIHFTLRDTGPGIDPAVLPHLFERFWHSGNGGGLGLGLYISEKIVEAHGGKIWAESESGHGATFHFTLPTD